MIGKFELPELEERQEETPARTSKKKLRREMTEEQRTRERERFHWPASKRTWQKEQTKGKGKENAPMLVIKSPSAALK